ncbi:MAG: AbiTii protein [Patescibacteria group bacterium]|nr:AbiTii protein [Patescibacteria group bacterium]
MSSIIQELQIEATNTTNSVSDLLRKAKIVAVKLDLKEFAEWIEKELNGYGVSHKKDFPEYRIAKGEPKAWNPYHGWQPIGFTNIEAGNSWSQKYITQPVGELDDLAKSDSSTFVILYDTEAKNHLMKAIGLETDIKFWLGRNAVTGILDSVRNLILDWALRLEKAGVVGEGISFSPEDKKKAQVANTTYSIGHIENFAGAIGNIDHANVTIQQANGFSQEKVIDLVSQIQKFLPEVKLKTEETESVKMLAKELKEEMSKDVPEQSKIKTALLSLKAIFEGVAGNVIAQGIIVELAKLLAGR